MRDHEPIIIVISEINGVISWISTFFILTKKVVDSRCIELEWFLHFQFNYKMSLLSKN